MKEIYDLIRVLRDNFGIEATKWKHTMAELPEREALLLSLCLQDTKPSDDQFKKSLAVKSLNDPNFRRYRRNVRFKLIQLIGGTDPDASMVPRPIQKAYYRTVQEYTAMQVLLGQSERVLASSISKGVLAKADKFMFTIIAYDAARNLSHYYLAQATNGKALGEKYYQASLKYLEVLRLENEILYQYSILLNNYTKEQSFKPAAIKQGIKIYKKYHKYTKQKIHSYKFYIQYYMLGMNSYEADGNYKKSIAIAREALVFFKNLPFEYPTGKIIVKNHIINILIMQGDYREAKRLCYEVLPLHKRQMQNWLRTKHLLVKILIHEENFEAVYDEVVSIKKSKTFDDQTYMLRYLIFLYDAYCNFLLLIGKITNGPKPSRRKINKFMQKEQPHEKEVEGLRIPYLILKILFSIYYKDYKILQNDLIDLEQFCKLKLLKTNPNYRSNCFIKMLLEIPKANYHPIAIKRYTERFGKSLSAVTFKISNSSTEIEIFPYEQIWTIILEHLAIRVKTNA